MTGSGTGTHDFDHEPGVLTELQVGSYVFSDVIYDGVDDGAGRAAGAFATPCSCIPGSSATSIAGFATSDAGSKSFAMDGPPRSSCAGAPAGSRYDRFGDEFGKVVLPDPAAA